MMVLQKTCANFLDVVTRDPRSVDHRIDRREQCAPPGTRVSHPDHGGYEDLASTRRRDPSRYEIIYVGATGHRWFGQEHYSPIRRGGSDLRRSPR